MALHTKKYYYRRDGVTYSIDLYTTIAEVGSDYCVLYDGSTPVYAKIGDVSDPNVSYIRIFKGGVIKGLIANAVMVPTTVYDTSGTFSFLVPAGVTSISAKVWGSGGAGFDPSFNNYSRGGGGGFAGGTFSVTPGETLTLTVSNTPDPTSSTPYNGGFGGGGNGSLFTNYGGGGGGASRIHRGTTPIIVAAGGGGCSTGGASGIGGAGGGTIGQTGIVPAGRSAYASKMGVGGNQVSGGAGGTGGSYPGGAGSLGQGGHGSGNGVGGVGGGGGGGGYYGGGAGAGDTSYVCGGGGGGGSSYTAPFVTSASIIGGNAHIPGNSTDPDRGLAGNYLRLDLVDKLPIPGKIVLFY